MAHRINEKQRSFDWAVQKAQYFLDNFAFMFLWAERQKIIIEIAS